MRAGVVVLFATLVSLTSATLLLAQQSVVPIVGWLNPQPLSTSQSLFDGFRDGLSKAGFIDGDLVMAGNQLTLNGTVTGDILAAGQAVARRRWPMPPLHRKDG